MKTAASAAFFFDTVPISGTLIGLKRVQKGVEGEHESLA